MPSFRFLLSCCVLACSMWLSTSVLADGPYAVKTLVGPEYATGFQSISENESEQLLRHLVEGNMSGRGTGQEGYLNAARWFAEQLKGLGFQPGGPNGSWFQNVPFIKLAAIPEECRFVVRSEEAISGKDIGISDFAGVFEATLPVTFLKAKDELPEIAESAFVGRLLVVQSSSRIAWNDPVILKTKPACLLIVSDDGRVRNEAVNQSEQTPSTIPVATLTRAAANSLAAKAGVQSNFFSDGNPQSSLMVSSDQNVDMRLCIEREAVDVPNVVGWYPGSDEAVRHEHICIGAHLDHLGIQRGELFPGADDNGSGSAAILQVAKAIHTNPLKPRRSVLMIAFCAEERGLLGSKYYVSNPLRPLSDMICMLNIDMIGRDEETGTEPASANRTSIHLVGSRLHSAELHAMVEKANESVGFEFEYDEETRVSNRSDQASFAAKGIPVTFLFGGFNPHYHKPSDTMDGINFSKIANAARLNYLTLMMAAEHGRFRPNKESATR